MLSVDVPARTPILSKRETEILQLVANGASNQEIAERLGIREQTVKNHLSSVFSKLKVRRRGAAVAKAIKQGLVTMA